MIISSEKNSDTYICLQCFSVLLNYLSDLIRTLICIDLNILQFSSFFSMTKQTKFSLKNIINAIISPEVIENDCISTFVIHIIFNNLKEIQNYYFRMHTDIKALWSDEWKTDHCSKTNCMILMILDLSINWSQENNMEANGNFSIYKLRRQTVLVWQRILS